MKYIKFLFYVVLAIPFFLASLNSIRQQVASTNLVTLAEKIEKSENPSIDTVKFVLAEFRLNSAVASCQDSITRAWTTLSVFELADSLSKKTMNTKIVEISNKALQSVDHRLKCVPTDGNAWLMRAQILQSINADNNQIADALANSYRFAPAEWWVMKPRFEFATEHLSLVEDHLSSPFRADIASLMKYGPADEIAQLYVGSTSAVRVMFYDALSSLPKIRRDSVAKLVDRLGVSLRVGTDCNPHLNLPLGHGDTSIPKKANWWFAGSN